MLLPILASIGSTIGIHPYILMISTTIAASCAFMLPVATPPNAIVFGSGYLKMNDKEDQEATHAWTEVYVDNLGWVGIDVSNNIIVDENYIVLATGFDYKDAKPLHGIQFESENNSIKTAIKVQQQSLRVEI